MQNYRIKFAFKHVNSPVACCALSTKVGTRNENPEYNGLAHFNEHMLFKGTEKRGSVSINNVLENVGGELNAYTTKEETVIHATVLKEDLKKAINLLFELAFTSVYPQKELVKEIEVVYEEIISYKDSPAESIYDDFESLLYSGHPLSLQILGQKKTLNKITPAILKNYLSEFFIPENMAITIVADYSEQEIVKMINSALKHFKKECVCSDNLNTDIFENYNKVEFADKNLLFNSNKPFYIERLKHNHQAHCIIGNRAYSFYDEKKRLALAMLTNILGGPATNSRLNMVLRERNALVYNVEAMYNCYLDSGVFAIYFGCDKSLVEKCLSLIYKELEHVIECELTSRELFNAKKQLLGQLSIAADNSEAQCLCMGKSLMVFGYVEPLLKTREKIESLTSKDLLNVAREIFVKDKLSVMIYK